MLKQLGILLVSLSLISCSAKDPNTSEQATSDEKLAAPQQERTDSPNATLKVNVEPRVSQGLQGNFTDVSFTIQERPWHPLIKGKLNCTLSSSSQASCETTASLSKLKAGAYRIILYTNFKDTSDGLACDYFEFQPGTTPNLTISPKSSGECILWQLKGDTKLSEEQIKDRVRHILNDDTNDDYDLELTLYDLYKYYDERQGWQQAWNILVDAVRTNQPLQEKANDSMINGSGKPIF